MIKDRYIFGQRLKILKSEDITDILKTFFEEIKLKLKLLKEDYDKSNDQKIIQAGIKDLTGNLFTDNEILSLINDDKEKYLMSFEKLFSEKRNTRVEKIGSEQNKEIEKKLFANYRFFLEITYPIFGTIKTSNWA